MSSLHTKAQFDLLSYKEKQAVLGALRTTNSTSHVIRVNVQPQFDDLTVVGITTICKANCEATTKDLGFVNPAVLLNTLTS